MYVYSYFHMNLEFVITLKQNGCTLQSEEHTDNYNPTKHYAVIHAVCGQAQNNHLERSHLIALHFFQPLMV